MSLRGRGDVEIVRLVAGRKAALNASPPLPDPALTMAVDRGDRAVVSLLFDGGADTNKKCVGGRTPLWCAPARCDIAILK